MPIAPIRQERQSADELIRIGDPNQQITGEHKYAIAYHVRRAINFIAGAPELYWNVTGNEWPYEIEQATATVHAPPTVPLPEIRRQSFCGPPGSTTPGMQQRDGAAIKFSGDHIMPSSGLTIVAQLPARLWLHRLQVRHCWTFIGDWSPAVYSLCHLY